MLSALLSSRLWSAVAFVAILFALSPGRWGLLTAGQPQPPPAPARAAAPASSTEKPVAIPRIHLRIALPRDSAGERERGAKDAGERGLAAASQPPDQDRSWAAQIRVAAASGAPAEAPDGLPGASESATVPQLMVCHLDVVGAYAAADALQECIRRAPAYSSVEIPPGVYVLHRQVVVTTPLTIRTAGTRGSSVPCTTAPGRCASFVAAPDFSDPWGLLVVRATNNVALEHIVIDGNEAARGASWAARSCAEGRNIFGFNATVLDCDSCNLADVLSRNALCGTGMVWVGANASIQRSIFQGNGNAAASMWSDGLTVIYGPQSLIVDNQFVDNSDVALILGYGVSSRIERNVVRQREQSAFAGLMLHNFNSRDLRTGGDFRGAVIANNTVDCGPQRCVFGIQIGPGPWNTKLIVVGGDVHDNVVRGAKVGINVDGAGLFRAPVIVRDNVVSDVPSAYFSDCAKPIATDAVNISPTSIVDRADDRSPAGSSLSNWCQLFSNLSPMDKKDAP